MPTSFKMFIYLPTVLRQACWHWFIFDELHSLISTHFELLTNLNPSWQEQKYDPLVFMQECWQPALLWAHSSMSRHDFLLKNNMQIVIRNEVDLRACHYVFGFKHITCKTWNNSYRILCIFFAFLWKMQVYSTLSVWFTLVTNKRMLDQAFSLRPADIPHSMMLIQ